MKIFFAGVAGLVAASSICLTEDQYVVPTAHQASVQACYANRDDSAGAAHRQRLPVLPERVRGGVLKA